MYKLVRMRTNLYMWYGNNYIDGVIIGDTYFVE